MANKVHISMNILYFAADNSVSIHRQLRSTESIYLWLRNIALRPCSALTLEPCRDYHNNAHHFDHHISISLYIKTSPSTLIKIQFMQVVRKYTTLAHSPRSDSRSLLYRDALLDLAYSVHSQELPHSTAPSASKLNILFMHGAQYTKESWYYWIDCCFEQFGSSLDKCIAFDHVHHGESAFLNESKVGFFIPWDDLGRDAGCIIKECIRRGEINRDAPLIVIAHSMSGTGAMALSVFEPSLVSAMVLIDPVWMGLELGSKNVDALSGKFGRMAYSSYKRTKDTFTSFQEYREYMENKSLYAQIHPRIRKDVIDNLWRAGPNNTVRVKMSRTNQSSAYYSGLSAVGVGESLVRRVRTPTLVLHGDIADFNPVENNVSLAETIPRAERHEIQHTGHLVCYTHPDESFGAVKGFISRQFESALEHNKKVDSEWGRTAEQKFLEQVERHNKGVRSAGFSKL